MGEGLSSELRPGGPSCSMARLRGVPGVDSRPRHDTRWEQMPLAHPGNETWMMRCFLRLLAGLQMGKIIPRKVIYREGGDEVEPDRVLRHTFNDGERVSVLYGNGPKAFPTSAAEEHVDAAFEPEEVDNMSLSVYGIDELVMREYKQQEGTPEEQDQFPPEGEQQGWAEEQAQSQAGTSKREEELPASSLLNMEEELAAIKEELTQWAPVLQTLALWQSVDEEAGVDVVPSSPLVSLATFKKVAVYVRTLHFRNEDIEECYEIAARYEGKLNREPLSFRGYLVAVLHLANRWAEQYPEGLSGMESNGIAAQLRALMVEDIEPNGVSDVEKNAIGALVQHFDGDVLHLLHRAIRLLRRTAMLCQERRAHKREFTVTAHQVLAALHKWDLLAGIEQCPTREIVAWQLFAKQGKDVNGIKSFKLIRLPIEMEPLEMGLFIGCIARRQHALELQEERANAKLSQQPPSSQSQTAENPSSQDHTHEDEAEAPEASASSLTEQLPGTNVDEGETHTNPSEQRNSLSHQEEQGYNGSMSFVNFFRDYLDSLFSNAGLVISSDEHDRDEEESRGASPSAAPSDAASQKHTHTQ